VSKTGRGEATRVSRPRRAVTLLVGLVAGVTAILIVFSLGYAGFYDVSYAASIVPVLVEGAQLTILYSVVVISLGLGFGFLIGWGRTTRRWFLRSFGALYVEFFRSMPPLVLIAFAALVSFFVVRRYFPVLNPFAVGLAAGAFALALHSAAYQAEVVRAGILSVPSGQTEAAEAIGLRTPQIMVGITLPQAFRVSLPSLGNQFASDIKDTSLLSAIAALELSWRGESLVASAIAIDFNLAFIIWTEVAALYFIITFIVTRTVRAVENRYKVPGLEAAQI